MDDNRRNVIIPAQTWMDLILMGKGSSPNDPVFEGRGKRVISQTEIRRIIQAAAERVGINKKCQSALVAAFARDSCGESECAAAADPEYAGTYEYCYYQYLFARKAQR